jgi:hypothetical protein
MVSLIVDMGLLVGVLGYGAYLVSLLIQGSLIDHPMLGNSRISSVAGSQSFGWAGFSSAVSSAAFSSVNGKKRSLVFQRVGRRV